MIRLKGLSRTIKEATLRVLLYLLYLFLRSYQFFFLETAGESSSTIRHVTCALTGHIDFNCCNLSHTGPTLLLTSDIIKQRLGAAALDRYVAVENKV